MFKFIKDIGRSIVEVFKGRSLFWVIFAIVLTFVFVKTGLDWEFFLATRGKFSSIIGLLAGILGFIVPVFVPIIIYLIGYSRKDSAMKETAIKGLQAVITALIIIAVFKAFTGRIQPDFLTQMSANPADISGEFNFGFWRHGIFWGWPSSHAGTALSLSVFLTLRYRNKKWVGFIALLYASLIAIGAGMSFHWLSDAIAGTIIGSLVGIVIAHGKNKIQICY